MSLFYWDQKHYSPVFGSYDSTPNLVSGGVFHSLGVYQDLGLIDAVATIKEKKQENVLREHEGGFQHVERSKGRMVEGESSFLDVNPAKKNRAMDAVGYGADPGLTFQGSSGDNDVLQGQTFLDDNARWRSRSGWVDSPENHTSSASVPMDHSDMVVQQDDDLRPPPAPPSPPLPKEKKRKRRTDNCQGQETHQSGSLKKRKKSKDPFLNLPINFV